MPNYSDKILVPAKPEAFKEAYELGKFAKQDHKAFFTVLYYLGIRCSEALAIKKEDVKIYPHSVFINVYRLKNSRSTEPLELNREWLGVNHLIKVVNETEPNERVFPYCRKTGYNIIKRGIDAYPQYLRFSMITNFLLWGWSIPEIRGYTGLSVESINYYILSVDLKKRHQELTQRYL